MEKLKWFSYLLLLASIHGAILIAILRKMSKPNKAANFNLSMMIVLVITALIGRLAFDPLLFRQFPHFVIIADVFIFLFGPFFFFYVRAVLTLPELPRTQKLLHFVPATAHLISMIPQILLSKDTYIHMMMVERTPWLFVTWLTFEGLAIILNFGYLYLSYRVIQKHKNNPMTKTYHQYIYTILILLGVCLAGWAQGYVLYFFNIKTFVSFIGSNLGWLLPMGVTYYLGYLMTVKPQLFQMPIAPKIKYQNSPLGKSDMERSKEKLEDFMQSQRPYINTGINLNTLAEMLDTKPANLSRVINECYDKNFFDFINAYRIQHFIEIAPLPEHRHKTLLGIALEVGFNSKSTFNRAFKKETQMTPTAYFKQLSVSS